MTFDERRIVEAEFREPADLEILDQDVGTRRELAHDALAVLALEVEFDRALAAVGGVEIGGAEMLAVLGRDERRPPAAGVVAGALALDLGHFGAEVGQNLARPTGRRECGQVRARGHRLTAQTWRNSLE